MIWLAATILLYEVSGMDNGNARRQCLCDTTTKGVNGKCQTIRLQC